LVNCWSILMPRNVARLTQRVNPQRTAHNHPSYGLQATLCKAGPQVNRVYCVSALVDTRQQSRTKWA
jgi:hypothetical protein